jgi:bacillithiol biosynthesis cysteine-adding enzyme BshC
MSGSLPQWYPARAAGAAAWSELAASTAADFSSRSWLDDLAPAFRASGEAARRLESAARSDGVVVTGGQQPGLFGGPLYVLHKALTVLELANAIATATGRPVAPVFWAATDDTDFAEANHVSVVRRGRLDTLSAQNGADLGLAMAATPLGDVSEQFARLAEASGSAPAMTALDNVRAAYNANATVGSAYVDLLRSLLEPLGIAVLDAAHPAVRAAAHTTLMRALESADTIAASLAERTTAIGAAGFRAQVAHVPNLSLVFETLDDGTRRRIPLRDATEVARDDAALRGRLGPNVLLRPIVERQILPTVSYVGGPGEVAYFAQLSAVSEVLGVATPRIIPRWSGTLIEPHVADVMARLDASIDDFADPHAMEGKFARAAISGQVRRALDELRTTVTATSELLRGDDQTSEALSRSIGSMQAGVEHRLARLERRYAAAIKQAGTQNLDDVAMLRATLYPNRAPQERILSFIPFIARDGDAVIEAVRVQARAHVDTVMNGD